MPQKNPQERGQKAKARGIAMTQKKTDLGLDTGGKSNHANKKSQGILRRKGFSERNVSVRSPPGEGRAARPGAAAPVMDESENRRKRIVPEGAAKRYRKDGTKKARSLDRGSMPVATTDGRGKKPSRMNVKGKGGPFKRSRLHGG